jgi:hypothetical protein
MSICVTFTKKKSMTKFLYTAFVATFIFSFGCKSDNPPNETQDASSVTTQLSKEDKEKYIAQGKSIAQASFKVLSSALQKAIQEGNVSNGIRVCNGQAGSLIDSLSIAHHAKIKRTSLRIRNLANTPTKKEQRWLNYYKKRHEKEQKLKAFVESIDAHTVAFYAPILTKPLCLKCHGVFDSTLDRNDYSIIQSLYTRDEALGYKEGDLRGIWSITLSR